MKAHSMEEKRKSGLLRHRKKWIAKAVLLTSASEIILLKFLNIERKKAVSRFFLFCFFFRQEERRGVYGAYIAGIRMKVFSKKKSLSLKKTIVSLALLDNKHYYKLHSNSSKGHKKKLKLKQK